jgi:hypothetical protein
MKPRTRTFRGAKKFGNAISVAGTNARKTDGLFKAANHLVAKRMTLGAAAMSDPLNADHVELTKIIQDKTKAFAEVGMIWLQRSGEIAAQMAGFAANEMATIAEAMASRLSTLSKGRATLPWSGSLERYRNRSRLAPSLCKCRVPRRLPCTGLRRQTRGG